MKRKTELIIASLFILTLSFACKKVNYVTMAATMDHAMVNQTVTYELKSNAAESYNIKIADTSFYLTETDVFDYTWTSAGTFRIDVAAYNGKSGKPIAYYCRTVHIFNDATIYDGNYLLEGTCNPYTVSSSHNGAQGIKLDNFADLGFEVLADTHGHQGRAFTIRKQEFTGEEGTYFISGQGNLNGAEDWLEMEYIIDYEDSIDPDLNYHEFCKMKGLKL